MPRIITFLLLFVLMGCTSFPALDDAVSASAKAAPYPKLAPIDGIMARANAQSTNPVATPDALSARAAALRARAARLQRPVVDASTRSRMEDAVQRRPE